MKWRASARFAAAAAAALVWALAAGSALLWALRTGGAHVPVDAPLASAAPAGTVDARAVARALGASDAAAAGTAAGPAELTARLALRGIVTHDGHGAALIAVDGKPARPVREGAQLPGLEGGWTVRALTPRAVLLESGDQQARLELPPLSERSSAADAAAAPPPPAPITPKPVPAPIPRGQRQ